MHRSNEFIFGAKDLRRGKRLLNHGHTYTATKVTEYLGADRGEVKLFELLRRTVIHSQDRFCPLTIIDVIWPSPVRWCHMRESVTNENLVRKETGNNEVR